MVIKMIKMLKSFSFPYCFNKLCNNFVWGCNIFCFITCWNLSVDGSFKVESILFWINTFESLCMICVSLSRTGRGQLDCCGLLAREEELAESTCLSTLEQGGSKQVVGCKIGVGNKSFGLGRIGVLKVWWTGRIEGVSALGSSWESPGGSVFGRGGGVQEDPIHA